VYSEGTVTYLPWERNTTQPCAGFCGIPHMAANHV
jgi:hypothetical protein